MNKTFDWIISVVRNDRRFFIWCAIAVVVILIIMELAGVPLGGGPD